MGLWTQNTAAQLVILSIPSSTFMIGAINIASTVHLLLSLVGGTIADRFDRWRIIMSTQMMIATLSATGAGPAQQLAPDEMRGRVLSVNGLAFNGVMPFSMLSISTGSTLLGIPIVLAGCAIALAIGSVALWKRYTWQAFAVPTS